MIPKNRGGRGDTLKTDFQPGRPTQLSPAQQMHVQVKDRLPGTRADVEHGPVAIVDAALPIRKNVLRFSLLGYNSA